MTITRYEVAGHLTESATGAYVTYREHQHSVEYFIRRFFEQRDRAEHANAELARAHERLGNIAAATDPAKRYAIIPEAQTTVTELAERLSALEREHRVTRDELAVTAAAIQAIFKRHLVPTP